MTICTNPPCDQAGPFRYCPVKGCSWTDEMTDEEAVMSALRKAVEAKRSNPEFMARLRANIEKHADLLDRLADG